MKENFPLKCYSFRAPSLHYTWEDCNPSSVPAEHQIHSHWGYTTAPWQYEEMML